MAITVDWGDADETLIVWKFGKSWTHSDFLSALVKSNAMQSTHRPQHCIADLRQMIMTTADFSEIARALKHSNHIINGLTVAICHRDYWQTVYNDAISRVTGRQVTFVRTVDEAYHLIDDYNRRLTFTA